MKIPRILVTVVGSVLCAACAEQEAPWAPPVAFDTARVMIRGGPDSVGLLVEVSRTAAQQSFGLMSRPSLDPESGMIFLYDSAQAGSSGYWMFRTKMPLDIAFMDSAGAIGEGAVHGAVRERALRGGLPYVCAGCGLLVGAGGESGMVRRAQCRGGGHGAVGALGTNVPSSRHTSSEA